MNWGEFKATVEAAGMEDGDELSSVYLDMDGSELKVTKYSDGTKSIGERGDWDDDDDEESDDDTDEWDDEDSDDDDGDDYEDD